MSVYPCLFVWSWKKNLTFFVFKLYVIHCSSIDPFVDWFLLLIDFIDWFVGYFFPYSRSLLFNHFFDVWNTSKQELLIDLFLFFKVLHQKVSLLLFVCLFSTVRDFPFFLSHVFVSFYFFLFCLLTALLFSIVLFCLSLSLLSKIAVLFYEEIFIAWGRRVVVLGRDGEILD